MVSTVSIAITANVLGLDNVEGNHTHRTASVERDRSELREGQDLRKNLSKMSISERMRNTQVAIKDSWKRIG